MWYQHDGAPAHYSQEVRHLNNEYPERWIGRAGPVQWPARSPDLTKLDFFLWGYVKERVYREQVTTREDMMVRVRQAFESINANVLQNVNNSFLDKVHKCIVRGGGHIEHVP